MSADFTQPGPMWLTVMACCPSSIAMVSVSARSACLVDPYTAISGKHIWACTDDVNTIRPPLPCSTMRRAAAWPTLNAPVRLTPTMRSQLCSLISVHGSQSATPAFEAAIQSGPSSASTRSTRASTWARSETSARTNSARRPRARSSSASCSPASS